MRFFVNPFGVNADYLAYYRSDFELYKAPNASTLSGGQRLNKLLTMALSESPDVLLLDEPSNHLDKANRKSLLRMLQTYPGTLIMVSHDKEYLSACVDTFWHIEQGEITIFHGHYADYIAEREPQKTALEQEHILLINSPI